ncbi:MAG: peptidoglycan DD-metalloendopeptidase family protein [Caldilineaceae bacterium]
MTRLRFVGSEAASSALTHWLEQVRAILADQITPLRLASHLSVVAVAALILLLSQIHIPAWEISLRLLPSNLQDNTTTAGSRVSIFTNEFSSTPLSIHDSLQRSAIPFTIVNEDPQQGVRYYTVQAGDTILGIAGKFGLRPESVQWSNPALEQHVDLIRPGDQIIIPPMDGAVHKVAIGDTLSSIADRYDVSVEDIIGYAGNGLTDNSAALAVGQELMIPGGTRPYVQSQSIAYAPSAVPATAQIGSGAFVWPTSGPINQPYWSGHPAVDIGGWTGAPVKAADGGYVALAASGWNGGYGNHVIVDHGNGFSTLYAHLNSIYVHTGENVARGQQIGSLGTTGNSTGPHLHLEIRYQGVPRNPMGYLP